jgi:iron complex outermembrane receptor protein
VALAYRKNKLNVGAKGTEGDGKRFSILYVDQFADRTIGLALGFARLDEKGGTPPASRAGATARRNSTAPAANLNVPYNGFNAWADQESRKRDGASATVQFKPNKNFTSTLDLFYSTFDKVKTNTGFQAPLNDAWNGNPGHYDSGGVLTQATVSGSDANSGTFNKVRAVVRNDSTSEKDKIKSIGWNNKFKIGEDWSVNADLSKSNSKRDGGIIETTAGTAQSALGTAQLDTVAYTNAGQFTPGLNYTDRSIIKLTDVQGWGGGINSPQAGYSKVFKVEDDLTGIRLSAKREPVSGPDRGSRRRPAPLRPREDPHLHRRSPGHSRPAHWPRWPCPAATPPRIPTPGGSVTVASFDSSSSIGSVYGVARKLHPDIYNKDWTTKEKVTTAFAKGDIDGEIFGLQLRGNVGLQSWPPTRSPTAFNVDRTTCASTTRTALPPPTPAAPPTPTSCPA